jgi:hypothetical protein
MQVMKSRRLDILLLFILLAARVRIDTLADLVLPTRHQDLLRLPIVQRIFSPHALELLQDWLTDPLSLVLIGCAFAGFLLYLLADLARRRLGEAWTYRLKLGIVFFIIAVTVISSTLKLVALRREIGPASYCHDGGVIQTEEVIKVFLAGENPYIENYIDTPLAEWGIDFHSAVYHYPYLPWTYVFSAPFFLLSQAILGWFDQRLVYLLLFVLTLAMSTRLAAAYSAKLMLVMALGLNPIMANDVIFGQNDSFVLFWIVLMLWLLPRSNEGRSQSWRYLASSLAAGLACASKPTAWFIMPFYLVHLLDIRRSGWRLSIDSRWAIRLLPLAGALATLIVPYLIWDAPAMIDDVWKWSSGTSDAPYQIRGWGAANWVLALGLVESRLSYFPFWIMQALTCLPLSIGLLWRQAGLKTSQIQGLANVVWNGALLFMVYAFFSRFLNENYVGFVAALFAIGALAGGRFDDSAMDSDTAAAYHET